MVDLTSSKIIQEIDRIHSVCERKRKFPERKKMSDGKRLSLNTASCPFGVKREKAIRSESVSISSSLFSALP